MLRRTHALHRDIPSRAETDVARATKGAGRMTDRRSQIINPGWMHRADPAQAICVHQLSARSQITNPPRPWDNAWQLAWEASICSHVQKAKRCPETTVASTGSAIYP